MNMKILLIILILSIIFYIIFYIINSKLRGHLNISENFESEKPIIWMYWETKPGSFKPGYIDLCIDSVKFNCGKCFNVIVLDNHKIYSYIPEIKDAKFMAKLNRLSLPQKVDYYRYILLEKYGGVWIDADILILKCICPYYDKLKTHDYVGFGCGHDLSTCKKTMYGYSKPLNWFMMSRPNTDYMKCIKSKAEAKINDDTKKFSYHGIGKVILSECYNDMNTNKQWDYHHVPSKCQEYDTKGNKLNNILNNFEWEDCDKERFFFPLYNTAPGYPDWFKKLSKEELMENTEIKLGPIIKRAFEEKYH